MMNHVKTILIGLSIMAVAISCQKSGDFALKGDDASRNTGEGAPARTMVTINANLPDGGLALAKASIGPRSGNEVILIDDLGEEPETKVSLIQDEEQVKVLKPSWEENDKILVNGVEFTLTSGEGTTGGVFVGGDPGAAPYDIQLVSNKHMPANFNNQTQASDGSTAHLGYDFVMTGATCYGQDPQHAIQFTEDWAVANGATISNQPSILRLRAMMPPSISSAVKKVIFRSSAAVFNGSNTLTVNLTTPGVTSGDNILDVYATLPYAAPSPTIPDILIQFQVSNNEYDKYSFYHAFNGSVSPGCTHVINIACTNILNNANRQAKSGSDFVPAANAGTSANPYYIADQHQLKAMRDYLPADATLKYYKVMDDIDMTGVDYETSPTAFNINFDGNNKTVSNLGAALFTNFGGTLSDLTIEDSTSDYGMLAKFVDGSGSAISNVSVVDCTVSGGIKNVGGLVGKITGASSTLTDCSVSGTNITGAARVGGIMGDAGAAMTVSGCSYSDGTITYDDDLVDTEKKYFGGVVGFIENHAIIFQDCHVTGDVTIDVSARVGDARTGGFVGQNYTAGTIKGCSVGTSLNKVLLKTNVPDPTAGVHNQPINVGGFAGVNYGLITKNGDVRNEAHAKIVSNNDQDFQVNLGGFVGYHRGTIEYSDADADLSGLTGQFIGGFCGRLVDENNNPTVTRHNRVLGSTVVSGTDIVGGYAGGVNKEITEGYTPDITVDDCQVASGVTVSGANTLGGFAGKVEYGVFTSSSSAAAVTGGSKLGGFLGENDTHAVSFTDCEASGNVTGDAAAGQYLGGFVGYSQDFATTYTNCRVRGSVINATAITGDPLTGGFAGQIDDSVLVYGCSVGVSGTPVQVRAGAPTVNMTTGGVGGFAGCCYGTVTKHDASSTRSSAYVTITATNTTAARDMNLGGFFGFLQGTVSYSDAVVTMTGLTGQRIAGFVARTDAHSTKSVTVDHCNVSGTISVSGGEQHAGFVSRVYRSAGTIAVSFSNNSTDGSFTGTRYTGGFAGYAAYATYSGNTSRMSVSGSADVGGFVGLASGGSFDSCESYGTVSATGARVGGFVGTSYSGGETYSGCYYRGTSVTTSLAGNGTDGTAYRADLGGFAGVVGEDSRHFTGSFTDCHVIANNQNVYVTATAATKPTRVGGFVGRIGSTSNNGADNTGTFEGCHTFRTHPTGGFYVGGLAGLSYVSISKCYTTGGNDGVVVGTNASVGGLVGYQKYNSIYYSYSTVNVSCGSTVTNVGGLVGVAIDATLEQCYACGTVTGKTSPNSTGGVVGKLEGSSVVTKLVAWSTDQSVAATRYYGAAEGTVTFSKLSDGTSDSNYTKPAARRYFSAIATNLEWDLSNWVMPETANTAPTLNL